jgi:hypothetical protein
MIRADRELLADLARMNSDVVPLAMQIIDDSATREEQQTFAERLIELGTRLSHRARHTAIVIAGDTDTSNAEECLKDNAEKCLKDSVARPMYPGRAQPTNQSLSSAPPKSARTVDYRDFGWLLYAG